jgi:hypothetical protein
VVFSFLTVLTTMKHQFGIGWEPCLLKTFAAISLVSFDFGVISGIFCLHNFNFYHSLLSLTGSLSIVVIAIIVRSWVVSRRTASPKVLQDGIFAAVYLLLVSGLLVQQVSLVHTNTDYCLPIFYSSCTRW